MPRVTRSRVRGRRGMWVERSGIVAVMTARLGDLRADALEHQGEPRGVAADVGTHRAEHVVGAADDRHEVGPQAQGHLELLLDHELAGRARDGEVVVLEPRVDRASASASASAHEPAPGSTPAVNESPTAT